MAQSVFANGGGAVSSNGSKCEKMISQVIKKIDPCGTCFWSKTFTAKKMQIGSPREAIVRALIITIRFYTF
jgi:hypothetical protein